MTAIAINTLAISKRLQEAGYNQKQADAQAEIWADVIEDNIATKRDLLDLERSLRQDIKELELRLVIRLGGVVVVAIGVVATLVKLL